ncbi:hypothetical protein HH1059_23290 [Halorhodospira halochloris]|uniref:Uncharacterized protein n=1 Tax=Halorhodospira halochloris TaxID=1052 RepID=A0A110B4H4_HALHR|nr:hypothetical protein [Halorhodospira halochloris]MBK1651088.1 hypothetical protein [Halorhodospira halochloris]BAU56398.1 hypothetical protein HH1059_23290 [Halorhodospira halochloris]
MQYDRVIKGALVATMGSVLAIGAGNVMADVHEDATDSFDVKLNVYEPISVGVSDEAELPETFVEGENASDDYSFSVSGEDEAEFTYWTEHKYDAEEGLDLNDGVPDGSGKVGEDDITGTLNVTAEDAGEYDITVEATAEYDL